MTEPGHQRSGTPLSFVDAAWRRMESGVHPMTINVLLFLEGRGEAEALRGVLTRRLLTNPRFRQRIVPSRVGRPRWVDDAHFDVDAHFHRVGLPPPGDEVALRTLIDDLASTPLDPRRPPWQVHMVEGFGEDTVLAVRIHHCVADGVALVRMLHRLSDEGGVAAFEPALAARRDGDGSRFRMRRSIALRTASRPVEVLRTATRLLTLPRDPVLPLRGALGIVKRLGWTRPIPLDRLREVGRPMGATVNDVILTALAEAIHTELVRGSPRDHGQWVTAMVPVDLRRVEGNGRTGALGNRFGLMLLPLPIDNRRPLERLAAIKAAADERKASSEAAVALGILGVFGLSPAPLFRAGLDFFGRKASLVATDVVGPKQRLHIAGQRLRDLVVWAPPGAGLAMSVSLVSYAGSARVGIFADARVLPHPERLTNALEAALSRLGEATAAVTPSGDGTAPGRTEGTSARTPSRGPGPHDAPPTPP